MAHGLAANDVHCFVDELGASLDIESCSIDLMMVPPFLVLFDLVRVLVSRACSLATTSIKTFSLHSVSDRLRNKNNQNNRF